ncbi:hypothetical protein F4806DRAFT_54309 [Annulohypoxylon nitens]|nr:hypothetical protein F4806DRAFT_54309 [Annulohypoxylon nitens]
MDSLPPGTDLCATPAGQPPDGSPPNFNNPESLSTATLAVGCVMVTLTTIFVSARIWINWGKLRRSDYLTLIAFALQVGFSGIIMSLHKFNRHLWDIPICWMTPGYLKRLYAHTMMFGAALFFSKAAIFYLYLEIFGTNRKTRYLIYAGLVCSGLLYITFIPMASLYNAPRAGESWNELLAEMADLSKALVELQWSLAIGAGSTLLDFYIFVLPLPILGRLHISRVKRIQLILVFGTALLGVAASIVSLAYRVYLITDSKDGTWHEATVGIANLIENDIALIVGSMPAFSHFFRAHVAETSLWKFVTSAISNMGTAHSGSAKRSSSWPSNKPYGLRSHPRSDEGFELANSREGIVKSSVSNTYYERPQDDVLQVGQLRGTGGIVRTVDIFQQTQQHPGPANHLV